MDVEFWVEKCMRCVHCYIAKNDADELRCRCRNGCNFKEAKIGESTTEFGCRNCNEMIQGEQNE